MTAREPGLRLCDDLEKWHDGWQGGSEGGDICTQIANSIHCSWAETNIVEQVHCNLLKKYFSFCFPYSQHTDCARCEALSLQHQKQDPPEG